MMTRRLPLPIARRNYTPWTGCRWVLLIGLVASVALAETAYTRYAALVVAAFVLHLICRRAEHAALNLYRASLEHHIAERRAARGE